MKPDKLIKYSHIFYRVVCQESFNIMSHKVYQVSLESLLTDHLRVEQHLEQLYHINQKDVNSQSFRITA
ncbi:hypothetical protein EB796_012808 [Bugula neritina]|uniref:Uncharacterized protein n=1 Tax=Bugula neritina TaxID=10212 RepID=A0A7J7JSK9_BUGNE|nr:hypothetical protein EB796_012808 [Bugula neritina]